MLVGVGLAVEVDGQQVGAKGLAEHLLSEDLVRFAEGDDPAAEAANAVAGGGDAG